MPTLGDIITKDAILLDYNANSLDQALQAIATLASEMSGLRAQAIVEKLSERMSQGVGVGGGVAIPHARFEGLRRTIGFYVRLRVPLNLRAADGQAVNTMFVLLAPEHANAEHLKSLAQVARLLRTPESRDQLDRADTKESVYQLLAAA
jgi:PTS system nitrogen regulatory IIA component